MFGRAFMTAIVPQAVQTRIVNIRTKKSKTFTNFGELFHEENRRVIENFSRIVHCFVMWEEEE